MLGYCNHCKELSVAVKCYTRKADGQRRRVDFCLNKGCGYTRDTTTYSLPIEPKPKRDKQLVLFAMLLIVLNCGVASADGARARGGSNRPTPAVSVDMSAIKTIESKGNVKAINRRSGARGLYQITDIVRREYNERTKSSINPDDLFNGEINSKVAAWYLNVRIPQMIKYYHKELTINHILIAYNAGISYIVSGKRIPNETINYINRYHELAR